MADDEQPKIFVDEDWKAQVQREKELARQQAEQTRQETEAAAPAQGDLPPNVTPLAAGAAPGAGVPAGAPDAPAAEGAPEGGDPREEDPWRLLVSGLVTQTMLALGAIVPRGEKQVMVDLDYAVYNLSLLEALREKTQGNLTAEEEGELTQALGELQRLYQMRAQQMQEQTLRQAGVDDPNDLRQQ